MNGFNFSLFDPSTLLYALVIVIIAYIALFIPSMMVPGAKPEGVAKAISGYLWKSFGLLLLGMSVVQATMSVINNSLPEWPLLSALILLLISGIGIMVHASRVVATVDSASSVVPRLIFSHTLEVIGGLIAFVSALSLMLGFLITERVEGWQMPVTMILLGVTMMLSASLHISAKNRRGAKAVKTSGAAKSRKK